METGHGTHYSVCKDMQVYWTSFLSLGMDDSALRSRFDYVLGTTRRQPIVPMKCRDCMRGFATASGCHMVVVEEL